MNSDLASLAALNALLSGEEHDRARRFRFDEHRRRFIVARATLRILLGRYLEKRGEEICFEYGPKGKPRLGGAGGGSELRFNISHSNDLALMAFCLSEEVGVDIEAVREMDDTESILKNYFCPEEIEQWLSLPAQLRARGFFDCWTRKEAYIKAVGDGLSMPLNDFQVAFLPGEEPRIRMRNGDVETWSLFDISAAPDYAGALAIRGSGWKVRCYTMSQSYSNWGTSSTVS
ncbi:MAG TPA: 4'-phosphopantetheinyl transferase superfamily protein [Bryobacteraceae bacterium]